MSWKKQTSSRLGRSIVTAITSGTVSQTSTNFGSQTRQVRITSTLPLWITIGSTTATANSDTCLPAGVVDFFTVSPGQVLSFVSTSTSSGACSLTEMS